MTSSEQDMRNMLEQVIGVELVAGGCFRTASDIDRFASPVEMLGSWLSSARKRRSANLQRYSYIGIDADDVVTASFTFGSQLRMSEGPRRWPRHDVVVIGIDVSRIAFTVRLGANTSIITFEGAYRTDAERDFVRLLAKALPT